MPILILKQDRDEARRAVLAKCECSHPEHYVSFCWWEDAYSNAWNEMYVHVGMATQTFWRRVKFAIRYLFGYQSGFGAFEEVVLSPEDVQVLAEYLTDAATKLNKQNLIEGKNK